MIIEWQSEVHPEAGWGWNLGTISTSIATPNTIVLFLALALSQGKLPGPSVQTPKRKRWSNPVTLDRSTLETRVLECREAQRVTCQ